MRIDVEPRTIDLALAGDRAAVNAIVRALQGPLYNLARRILLDPRDAEDATQEVLLRILLHLSGFDRRSRFSTWAWRIAVNHCLNTRRGQRHLPVIPVEDFAQDLASGLEPEAPERADDAALLAELKIGCGFAMLATLDADHRLAYVLGEILDLTGEEAAEVLGTDATTYRKRLSRARERLAETLGAHCGLVAERNACRCHRRLRRALKMGRIAARSPNPPSLDLPALRREIAKIDTLVERVTAFYRADPALAAQRDFTDAIRRFLDEASQTS